MAYHKRLILCLCSAVLLILVNVSAKGQDTGAATNNVSSEAPRNILLERLQALEADCVPCMMPDKGEEYLTLLRTLGYHDLLAECLEKRLECNYEGAVAVPEIWRALGEAYMKSGPWGQQKAFGAFQHALTLKEDDVESHVLLAQLFHREGLYDQAEARYQKVLEWEPENARATVGQAALLARKGEITKASTMIDRIGTAAQPYDVDTRLMLRKALFDFERRKGWFDDNSENHAAYGRLLYRAGRIADALIAARRAVNLEPKDFTVWNFIAIMQIQLGIPEQARQAYDKSLEANPDQPQIEAARNQLINQSKPSSPE